MDEKILPSNPKELSAQLAEIERRRAKWHQMLDAKCDALILQLVGYTQVEGDQGRVMPLASPPMAFKGTKPAAVIFSGDWEVPVSTWRQAMRAVLLECAADPVRRERMLDMRCRVFGNFRSLLSETPDGMNAPLEICEGLYVEGKFDTQSLLQNITQKIFDRVGFDYRSIVVRLREPRLEMADAVQESGEPGWGMQFGPSL